VKTIKAGGPRPDGAIRLVSRSATGAQGNGEHYAPSFSPDGTRLAFRSSADNLAAGADNGFYQVLMKDLTADNGKATLVSRRATGDKAQGDDNSWGTPAFIDHGSRLVFTSGASNFVTGDTSTYDTFIATLGAPIGAADVILGGNGNDTLVGGPGPDRLTGGRGADRFVYLSTADSRPRKSKRDTIRDFNAAQGDLIDLRVIDANSRRAGNQAFTFIGRKPFDGKPGRLRFARGVLSGDTTGDRKANFAVNVQVTGGKLTGKNIRK
jgi:serralysin